MLQIGQTVRFGYNGLMRTVKVERVGKTYITGYVISENNVPKSFRFNKMFATQTLTA